MKIAKFIKIGLLTILIFTTVNIFTVHAEDEVEGDSSKETTETAPPAASVPMPFEDLQQLDLGKNMPTFYESGQHPDAPSNYIQPGIGTITSPVYYIIDLMRLVMSSVAVIMIFVYVVKLLMAGSEDDAGKIKTGLLVAVGGLLVIQLADIFVKNMFFGEQGDAFNDVVTAQEFAEGSNSILRGFIGIIQFVIAAVAVLVIIIRGFTLMVSAGNEEAMGKARNHVLYALGGLILVGLSELIVRGFLFPDQGAQLPDVAQGRSIIITITNYISGFIALIAFLVLLYTGFKYVVSAGNEDITEKAKKTFFSALIALLLAASAFAIVNTLIEMEQPVDSKELIQNSDS